MQAPAAFEAAIPDQSKGHSNTGDADSSKAPAAFGATTTDQRKGLTSNEKAHS
jgi:hypothetical protein